MFDITCQHCGEPWDNDELHGSEYHDYREGFKLFVKHGCGAFDAVWDGEEPRTCTNEPVYPEAVMESYRLLNQDMGVEWAEDLANHFDLCRMSHNRELPF